MVGNQSLEDLRRVYSTEEKWHGSDKKLNSSNHFCKGTVNFYPFRDGSIGAYGPVAVRIKVHCFFTKMIGTVQLFIGTVPFFLCRVNAPLETHITMLQRTIAEGRTTEGVNERYFCFRPPTWRDDVT